MVGCSLGEEAHGVSEAAVSSEKLVQARRSSCEIVSASLPTARKLSFGFLCVSMWTGPALLSQNTRVLPISSLRARLELV